LGEAFLAGNAGTVEIGTEACENVGIERQRRRLSGRRPVGLPDALIGFRCGFALVRPVVRLVR
jgi:hypothetical protein